MYRITDKQMDFILNDIRARGVEMESLQNDLLDHVCCLIEQHLGANENFEDFYHQTIQTFYKTELWEIEEETINLLTFKNYYVMKKIMILSGAATVTFLVVGIAFKFMHWPGASAMLMAGFFLTSFLFLPLLCTLKVKEKKQISDKLNLALGTLCTMLMTLHVWFKVMYWPYANALGVLAFVILLAVFLPLYFFSGIRHPETKVNTIVSSVLIVVGCGLVLTLVRTPQSAERLQSRMTDSFVRTEKLVDYENRQVQLLMQQVAKTKKVDSTAASIYEACDAIKALILEHETGSREPFAANNKQLLLLRDNWLLNYFESDSKAQSRLNELRNLLLKYRISDHYTGQSGIAIETILKALKAIPEEHSLEALNTLVQVQWFILQEQRDLYALN